MKGYVACLLVLTILLCGCCIRMSREKTQDISMETKDSYVTKQLMVDRYGKR